MWEGEAGFFGSCRALLFSFSGILTVFEQGATPMKRDLTASCTACSNV